MRSGAVLFRHLLLATAGQQLHAGRLPELLACLYVTIKSIQRTFSRWNTLAKSIAGRPLILELPLVGRNSSFRPGHDVLVPNVGRVQVAHGEDLNDHVPLERLGRVEPFDDGVRSRVLDGGAAKLDRLGEHAHDEVAVEEVLARLRIEESQVVVVSIGALVASLADIQGRRSSRNSSHVIVAVLRRVVRAIHDDASRIIPTANAAQV